MSEPEKTIDAVSLCALTGLTDKRHRQIAKEGWFPSPFRGQYLQNRTIIGLFKYYRESAKQRTARLLEEREKKLTAERRIKESMADQRDEILIPRHKMEYTYSRFVNAAKVLYQSTAGDLAGELAAETGIDPTLLVQPIEDRDKQIWQELARGEWAFKKAEDLDLLRKPGKRKQPKKSARKSVKRATSGSKKRKSAGAVTGRPQ